MENTLPKHKKNTEIALYLIVVLILFSFVETFGVLLNYQKIDFLRKTLLEEFIPFQELSLHHKIQSYITSFKALLYISSIILFLIWFQKAYSNIIVQNQPNKKSNLAIWSWFIPVYNLFKPVQIMFEIWNQSTQKTITSSANVFQRNGKIIITTWWFLYLITNFFGRLFIHIHANSTQKDLGIQRLQWMQFIDFIQLIEAILLMVIIINIQKMDQNHMKR